MVALGVIFLLLSSCAFQLEYTPTRYALVYGVGDYTLTNTSQPTIGSATLPNIPGASNDAQDFGNLLTPLGFSVTTKTDAAATYTAISADIADHATKAKPGDTVLFYFAGHGAVVYEDEKGDSQLFFANRTTSTTGDNQEQYTNARSFVFPYRDANWNVGDPELITNTVLTTFFDGYDPGVNIVIVVDACFAGGLIVESGVGVNELPRSYSQSSLYYIESENVPVLPTTVSRFLTYTREDRSNFFYISAAGPLEESWEVLDSQSNRRNGVFTTALRSALADPNTDMNRDNLITFDETYQKAYRDISSNWNAVYTYRAQYLPHISTGSMDLVLYELP